MPLMTPTQRTAGALAFLLLGYVFLGTLFDSYLNARQIVTPRVATWATVALVAGWCAVSLRLRLRPFPWIVFRGPQVQQVWVRRLGIQPTMFVAGVVLLLWMPPLVELGFPSPRQSFTRADREKIVSLLKAAPQPREEVQIGCPPTEEDACLVAGQLLQLFTHAGWVVQGDRVRRVYLGKPVRGIVLLRRPRVPGPGRDLSPEEVPPQYRGTEVPDDQEVLPQRGIEGDPRQLPDGGAPAPGFEGRWFSITPSVLAIEGALASVGLPIRRQSDVGGEIPENVLSLFVGPRTFEQRLKK